MIIDGTTIHIFDDGQWVIHTPQGRNFLVNEPTYRLFSILQNVTQPEEALGHFNTAFGASFNKEQLIELTNEKLGGYHILKDDETTEKPSLKNQYLKLKVELINSKIAGFLSTPITIFYDATIFWYTVVGLIVFLGSLFLTLPNQVAFPTEHLYYYFFLTYLTMPIHELGHIAACRKFGVNHGGVGFGFYYLLPVMYADITNVWLVSREKRVIANMGGIFSQMLYAAVLMFIYLFTDISIFYIVGLSIVVFSIWELNPFVRFDGYWILSDLTNTPNLVLKSKKILGQVWHKLKQFKKIHLTKQEWWLFGYGVINLGVFVLFMAYTLFALGEDIMKFPNVLWNTLLKLIEGKWDISIVNRQTMFILTFYILLIKFVFQKYFLVLLKRVGNFRN